MRYLLNNTHRPPIDMDILTRDLATLDCLIIENEGKRQCVSAEQVRGLDEINRFDCAMLSAVEWLFKEIRSNASLESVLNVVCEEGNFLHGVKNILCNYNGENRLHQYALQDKDVSYIKVDRRHRRIQLTYSNHVDMWKKYDSKIYDIGSISVPNGEFNIEGLDNEIGVQVGNCIYLKSGTEFCRYIIRTLEMLAAHKQAKMLKDLFITYITIFISPENSRPKELNRMIKNEVNKNEYFWEVVDRRDFSNVVLAKTYSLYSIDNWTRSFFY